MPHSSGGGSHSSGSHSGGSHSSHSSRSSGGGSSSGGYHSSKRTSSTPFKGAKRYLYYKDNKPYLVYANYDIRKRDFSRILPIWIICGFIFGPYVIVGIMMMFRAFYMPERIEYSKYKNKDPEFIIEDNIGVLENEKNLKKSMRSFYDTTGIVPAVITVSNDEWKPMDHAEGRRDVKTATALYTRFLDQNNSNLGGRATVTHANADNETHTTAQTFLPGGDSFRQSSAKSKVKNTELDLKGYWSQNKKTYYD